MNREERRSFARKARKSGISEEGIQAYINYKELGLGTPNLPRDIAEGDEIMLDLNSIKSHPNYEGLSQTYRDFVESHADEIFTAHVDRGGLISLKEHPEWLFFSGDLKPVEI